MNFRRTMGWVSSVGLVALWALAACGEIDTTPVDSGGQAGSAGSAGTAGAAGSAMAGSAGSAMAGSTAAGSSAAGSSAAGSSAAGSAGSGPLPDAGPEEDPPPCSGCIELRVPVTAASQTTYFNVQYAQASDFSAGAMTFRMRVLSFDENFTATPFVNQSNFAALEFGPSFALTEALGQGATDAGAPSEALADAGADAAAPAVPSLTIGTADAEGFFDVTFDLGAHVATSAINKSDIVLLGLLIGSNGAYAGGGDTIRVLLDSIRFTGVSGLADLEFTTGADNFVVNAFVPSAAGSEVVHSP